LLRRVMRRFLVTLLIALAAPGLGRAAQDPLVLEPLNATSKFSFDDHTQIASYTGGARLRQGNMELTADELSFHRPSQTGTARGHAILTFGTRRLLADEVAYDLRAGTFTAKNVWLGEAPIYLRGASAEGTRTQLTVHQAMASLGEPGPWTPTLAADTLTYEFGQRLQADRAHIGVGELQPIALPHFDYRLKDPLRSDYSLYAGYDGSLGVYSEIGLRLPVAAGLKLGGDVGLYSARGVLIGPAGDYAFGAGTDEEVGGRFRSGYINDHGDRKTDVLGRPVPADRSYLEWQHRERFGERLIVDGTFNYWRDSEVLRDYRPDDFFPLQTPDNFVEAVYTGDNYHLSLFARFQPDRYFDVQQRLPELRFDLLPIALPGGFYERFNASAAVLRDNPPGDGQPTLNSDRYDAYYSLTRPISPREWLAFAPVVGGRVTHYASTLPGSGRDDYTRELGEFGFDAQLRTSGTFDYQNERWKIDGLRHLFTPRISYRYIPESSNGQRYIPPIDVRTFTTYLPPLGLGDGRDVDELTASNTLRVGFDNTLQTRDPVYGSRDLLVFNVANDFRFKRQPGERDVSETHFQLGLMPASWLRFDLYQSIAPQNLKTRELNTGLTLHDGDAWSLSLATNYLSDDIAQYVTDYRMRLNEVYEAFLRLQYDDRLHRFNERTVGVRQNLNNIWLVRYAVTLYEGTRRESSFGFHVEVQFHGF
jgi:LPS-assembly protein